MMKLVTIVGARPQFVKAAVLSRLIRGAYADRASEFLVHTGQHYDENMSDVFFREMSIPEPDANLGIGGGGHGKMTGEMLAAVEAALVERKPDAVLVYGDTNSTLAGALAASKLGVPVAHVEAGLRSYNKRMPEEQNRIVADHLATWLFCPTGTAVRNLAAEGIRDSGASLPSSDAPRVFMSGDVMLDASLFYRAAAAARPEAERAVRRLGLSKPFRLLTLHRAENTDDRARLASIFAALDEAGGMETVFPLHPRTRKYLAEYGIALPASVRAIDPVGYFDMLELEESCEMVVTDSGGVQKEAYFFGKPCVTLRDQTEWVETVEAGWNRLAGADRGAIVRSIAEAKPPAGRQEALYGSGEAGRAILDALLGSRAKASADGRA